jgi:hypothetical protein
VYTKPPPGTNKELLLEKIRNYIYSNDEIALRTFISSIPELETIRQGINKADARWYEQLVQTYLDVWKTDCPFDISTTDIFTGKPEAAITARQVIKKGHKVKYLIGVMRTIGRQEREEAESIGADFSIIRLKGAKKDRVLVGPIRFVNHSCNANAMFAHHSEKTTEIRAVRDIEVGDEITVYYAKDYFQNEICKCLKCQEEVLASNYPACGNCKIKLSSDGSCPQCTRNRFIYGQEWPNRTLTSSGTTKVVLRTRR